MKKIIIYITIILSIIAITVSATYAFFSATASTNNTINANTTKLEVIYTGGTEISGILNLVATKEEGFETTVRIKLSEDSVDASADLYIQINEITSSIATEALRWEVHKTYEGQETYVDSGTFLDCENGATTKKCTNGDKIYIVKDYELTTTDTYYTVYIWLDGNKIGNEALGATLKAYIGAETEHITSQLNNS